MPNNALRIYKGINPNIDSYSAFFDNKKLSFTEMEQLLKEREVTDCYCCGIATDYCVGKKDHETMHFRRTFHGFPRH